MKIDRKTTARACVEFADRLVDLSDGELSADQRQLVQLHVAECAGCRAELERLDASLALLRRSGFQPVTNSAWSMPVTFCYAAALSLVLLLVATVGAVRFFGRDRLPTTAHRVPQRTESSPTTNSADSSPSPKPLLLDEATALHQIALIEQQARLQAALDWMPKDPWFAEQRAANEELLAKFKAATAAVTKESPEADESESGHATPCAGERS